MMMSSSRYFFYLGATYQNTLVAYNRIVEILAKKGELCGLESISNIQDIEKHGKIMYNSINIDEIDMEAVRKKFVSFAEQEPFLINDTIMYNILFTNDKKLLKYKEKLNKCANVLGMGDVVSNSSLDFIIDENNSNTSGGEKQKISILKVLYKDTSIMIFDEPTSALDSETKKQFMQYLQHIKMDKIIIIVTHDNYVKDECDFIIQI